MCVRVCAWAGGCVLAVRAHAYDLSFLFVSAMQSTKEKKSILTSFVSWKNNSIFSDQGIDRVLILYPNMI